MKKTKKRYKPRKKEIDLPTLEKDQENVEENMQKKFEKLKKEGNICMLKEDYVNALTFYLKAIEINQQDYKVFYGLSDAYNNLNNPIEGLHYAEKCLKIKPDYWEAIGQKLLSLSGLGQFQEGLDILNNNEYAKDNPKLQSLRDIFEINPNNPSANFLPISQEKKKASLSSLLKQEKIMPLFDIDEYTSQKLYLKNTEKGVGVFTNADIKKENIY